MIEDRITEADYNYLVDWFRDLIYTELTSTMVSTKQPTSHYDQEQIDWIQNCEFEEFMDGTNFYDDGILRTDDEDYEVNENTESDIIDAFIEARNIELENFYEENREYIW